MIGAERDFWPLPTIVTASDWRVGASDRERLGDAQARAVAERQHGGVARQHPGVARLAFPQRGRGHGLGVRRAQRPRQATRGLRRADRSERSGRLSAFAGDVASERFEGGERALQRAAFDPFRPAVGEKGAQIAWRAVGEIADCGRRAETLLEKGEILPGVAAVSLERARRQAPLVRQMAKPGGCRPGEIRRGRETRHFGDWSGLMHGGTMLVEGLSDGCGVAKALAPGARGVTIDRSNRLVKTTMTDVLEYQASEAKAKWAELLDEVERGRTVRITRHGKTIARVVPEAGRRTAEIAEAIERLKALREKTGKAPLAEILASRHEGHKY
jgi:prevent-host-death family protein